MLNKNKKRLAISILVIIILTNLFILSSPALAQVATPEPTWQGLVPCGRNSGTAVEQAPCTLCHLIVGFQRLVQYGMYMVVTLALVGIFFSGVMYMISSGDENMMTKAKTFLKVSLIGFTVVISGWLMVNVTMWVLGSKEGSDKGGTLGINVTSWNKFSCNTQSSQGSGTTPTVQEENNKERDQATPETANTQTGVADLPVLPITEKDETTGEEEEGSVDGPVDLVIEADSRNFHHGQSNSHAYGDFIVKNEGSGSTGPFTVLVTFASSRQEINVENIRGGESRTVNYDFRYNAPLHTWFYAYATADSQNQIAETNEDNNRKLLGGTDFGR